MAERQSFTARHAVTYETTPDGPQIVADQVVTAEADQRPAPARKPKPRPALPSDSATAGADRPAAAPASRDTSKE